MEPQFTHLLYFGSILSLECTWRCKSGLRSVYVLFSPADVDQLMFPFQYFFVCFADCETSPSPSAAEQRLTELLFRWTVPLTLYCRYRLYFLFLHHLLGYFTELSASSHISGLKITRLVQSPLEHLQDTWTHRHRHWTPQQVEPSFPPSVCFCSELWLYCHSAVVH